MPLKGVNIAPGAAVKTPKSNEPQNGILAETSKTAPSGAAKPPLSKAEAQ